VVVAHALALALALTCPVTKPSQPGSFNYGNAALEVAMYWPGGKLPAGIGPDGGSYATIEADGSIHAKVGWNRRVPGQLRITGRRLDAGAAPLRSLVPNGYGRVGFQPSGLVFATTGCWRVTGRVGQARLSFVVRVVKRKSGFG
jgi:hypothetical protein